MTPRRTIGGISVLAATRDHVLADIASAVENRRAAIVAFCNAHTVNLARRDPMFCKALSAATVLNDGVGLDVAMRLLGQPAFADNLNGTDLTPALLAILPADTAVYLLGSPEGVAAEARVALSARFAHLRFVGAEHGWFGPEDEAAVAARIKASGAQLVIVGMGQPRQELWAVRHMESIGAVLLCAGAYLDFAAGRFPRAPGWVQSARLEWMFRLLQEPRRLAHRYLVGNAAFLLGVVTDRLRGRS